MSADSPADGWPSDDMMALWRLAGERAHRAAGRPEESGFDFAIDNVVLRDNAPAFAVTFFTDHAAKTKREESLSLERLAERIRHTTAARKDGLPWLKLARFGPLPNPTGRSGSLRWNGNVLRVGGVVVDYDGEKMMPGQAAERLAKGGISGIVYTSPSHMLEGHGPRWRVCCPFSHELPPEDHYQMVARLNGLLGGVLAPESFTLSQSYYFGSVGGNPAHEVIVVDEMTMIDQCDELDRIAIGKPNGGNAHAKPGTDPQADIQDIHTALDLIPNPIPEWGGPKAQTWNQWNTIGMAIWRTSGGSPEGFEAFDRWSAKWREKYDAEETRFRWDHFSDSPPDQVGFGTLVHLARQARPGWVPPSRQQRQPAATVIRVVKGERHKAADAALAAMGAARTPLYQRDGRLARVCQIKAKNADGETILAPGIAPVSSAILAREMALAAEFQRYAVREDKWLKIDPPHEVVLQIMDLADEWPFPPITGVIGCPTMRRNGSILDTEGYDEQTGLVLHQTLSMPPVSGSPSRDEAVKAIGLLTELLREFPFVDALSNVVAVSMLITPVLRGAMAAAPMHHVDAPAPGTGKSYLADLASAIAVGERAAAQAWSPNLEETEKRLVGAALAGCPIISLDNCTGSLRGDFLCQVTERPLLRLRALGKSDQHRIANSFCVFANGNNVDVAGDMVRRTLKCSLDANVERPELREFKGDPLAAALRSRGTYISAALTIARAYIVAGKPGRLRPLASYEGWSDFVRSPLVWLGFPDPADSIETARASDPVSQDRAAFFEAWRSSLGTQDAFRVSEIIERATDRHSYDGKLANPDLNAILVEKCHKHRAAVGEISPERLGKWLASHENTIAVGLKLTIDRSDRVRTRYQLRSA